MAAALFRGRLPNLFLKDHSKIKPVPKAVSDEIGGDVLFVICIASFLRDEVCSELI